MVKLKHIEIHHIPRKENSYEDLFYMLSISEVQDHNKIVILKTLVSPSIIEKVNMIEED